MSKPVIFNEMIKIYFDLDANEWHGFSSESLWAKNISGDKYKIANSPFFAKGVSYDDVVQGILVDSQIKYKSTLIAGGHSTYRILLPDSTTKRDFFEYWGQLENLGCTYESTERLKSHLLSIDVPSSTDIYSVYSILEKAEENGIWSFEEGHCGHIVS